MKKILTAAALIAGFSTVTQAQSADLNSLLNKVREGRVAESSEHKQREAEFAQRRAEQQQMLDAERRTQAQLEAESARLEEQRRANETEITAQVQIRRDRLGQLQELFGVLQQAAGDAKSVIQTSHVSVDHADRLTGIQTLVDKASDTAELPSLDEIRAWPTQMMLEAIESGKVVTFDKEVRGVDGNTSTIKLTRIGDFGLVGEGKFYTLKNDGAVEELQRQPAGRFMSTVDSFQSATSGLAAIGVDPSRGQILNLEVEKPTLMERVDQGGVVGYVTLSLGAVGVFLAVVQFLYLFAVKAKVSAQMKSSTPNTNNPLGRVLAVYANNKNVDVETLELKLDEAILKETPALERFLTIIKLISAVAPLFGLLGTVTGMIATFQAITLFGTGDPTMMASGISQALVTTVEGLVVAIPTLLLHAFVAGASKSVIHVLEEQSAGIIAVHAEKEHGHAA
ncbi:MotA/TolQ/ExbB proton channel family protein [Gimibacter soli]|uniref:MotA/TolQ/ExbB proton channel family protein n=1 Tax=Gimibacter soli TaxID=3024400 RepID=A0AAE9XRI0_9PROT|nr:MotA/TolQ/ExbB proton channel family protein [Gimibacter soli]WCL54986.1 MotA/TolQ/ExbB proton channel family protein [Gimibacter soli]